MSTQKNKLNRRQLRKFLIGINDQTIAIAISIRKLRVASTWLTTNKNRKWWRLQIVYQ